MLGRKTQSTEQHLMNEQKQSGKQEYVEQPSNDQSSMTSTHHHSGKCEVKEQKEIKEMKEQKEEQEMQLDVPPAEIEYHQTNQMNLILSISLSFRWKQWMKLINEFTLRKQHDRMHCFCC